MQFFFIPIGFAVAAYASIFFFFSFGCPPLAEISDKHGEGERQRDGVLFKIIQIKNGVCMGENLSLSGL